MEANLDLKKMNFTLETQQKNLEKTLNEDTTKIKELNEQLRKLTEEKTILQNSFGTFEVNQDLRNNLENKMEDMIKNINTEDGNVKGDIDTLNKRLTVIRKLKENISNETEKYKKQKLEYDLIKEELNQELRMKNINIQLIKNKIKNNKEELQRLNKINSEYRQNVLELKSYIEKLNDNLQKYRNSQNVQEQKVSDVSP